MPRHFSTPLQADARLNRPHTDALPSHRQCPDCPQGSVLPLNADNFYEDRSRYPWNLSRFSARCKPHHNAMTAQKARANRVARSARERARRQLDKRNRVQAAIFYTPVQQELAAQRKQEARARKERIALFKRQMVRRRGGYSPASDGIKLMIKARMEAARRRRMGASHRTYMEQRPASKEDQ